MRSFVAPRSVRKHSRKDVCYGNRYCSAPIILTHLRATDDDELKEGCRCRCFALIYGGGLT